MANLNLHNFLLRSSEAFSLRTLPSVLRSLNQLTTENLLLKHFPFAKSRTRDLQSFCPLECKLEQSGDLSRDQDVAEVMEAAAEHCRGSCTRLTASVSSSTLRSDYCRVIMIIIITDHYASPAVGWSEF